MLYLFVSIVIISVIGTLLHFLYDWSNHNKFIGIFAAVNESTWEHIKIALTPTLLWGLVDGFIYGTNPNYFFSKAISLLTIIILMPLLFYGHKYIAKKGYFIFDIISFYIVIIISQLVFYYLLKLRPVSFTMHYLSCVLLFIIFGCYLLLTLLPIKNFLFKDPLTNKYGYGERFKENNRK